MRPLIAAAALVVSVLPAMTEDLPVLTVAAQMSGTVNWELQTIRHHRLDREHGFELELMEVAGSPARQIAFQAGEADVIVSDWIWVARQRAEGQDIAFIPCSVAVGGVMVPEGSDAETLQDLKGEQIGIAGGPLDKGWIIMRARAAQEGWDLAAETRQVFGAPPIIYQAGVTDEVAAVMNFWHFMAKEAAGMRHLISIDAAAEALGLAPQTPLLGYIVKGEMLAEEPEAVAGLARASRAARDLLRESDAEWERLRPIMGAENDAEFRAGRDTRRARTVRDGQIHAPADPRRARP